eukprot:PhM_4_TR7055/c0_g1_i1/m.86497
MFSTLSTSLCTDSVALDFEHLSSDAPITPGRSSSSLSTSQQQQHSFDGVVRGWQVLSDTIAPIEIPTDGTSPSLCTTRSYIFLVTSSRELPLLSPDKPGMFTPRGLSKPYWDNRVMQSIQRCLGSENAARPTLMLYLWNGSSTSTRTRLYAISRALTLERRLCTRDDLPEKLLYPRHVTALSSTLPTKGLVGGLNLSTAGRVEPDIDAERRARVNTCKPLASEILPGKLYVGGEEPATTLATLKAAGITDVVNLAPSRVPNAFPSEFVYHTFDLYDAASERVESLIPHILRIIHEARCVYVHCQEGVSRSISMTIAYVMWLSGRCFDEAFAHVKTLRSIASPNAGFMTQLILYETSLVNPSVLRVARFGPRKGRDGTPAVLHDIDTSHLFAPANNNINNNNSIFSNNNSLTRASPSSPRATPLELDPRTAYLFVLEKKAYLWQGGACSDVICDGAREAATTVLRFGYYTHGPACKSPKNNGTEIDFVQQPEYAEAAKTMRVVRAGEQGGVLVDLQKHLQAVCGRQIKLVPVTDASLDLAYTPAGAFERLVRGEVDVQPEVCEQISAPPVQRRGTAAPQDVQKSPPLQLRVATSEQQKERPSTAGNEEEEHRNVVLQYPTFDEPLDVFDPEDLDPTGAYLIWRYVQGKQHLYVWLGMEFEHADNPDAVLDAGVEALGEGCYGDAEIVFQWEGEESNVFLGLF